MRTFHVRLLLTTAAALIAFAGCATIGRPSDSEIIEDDVTRVRALVDSFDSCTSEEISAAVPVDGLEPVEGTEGAFSGHLAVEGIICTLMLCEDRACCNGCGGRLALAGEGSAKAYPLEEPTDENRYGVGAKDCSMRAISDLVKDTEVVVRGRFEAPGSDLVLAVERLCRISR